MKRRMIVAFGMILLTKFTLGDSLQTQAQDANAASPSNFNTLEEIGILKTKPGTWNTYLPIMLNNVKSARKEPGNISFTLYQPEDGSEVGIWVERWHDKLAFEKHQTYDYLKAVQKTVPQVKDGDVTQIFLKQVPIIPALPLNLNGVSPQRNVIVIFETIPERRAAFLEAVKEVTSHARKAPGNYGFNIYQDVSNPNRFVLVEGWKDKAAHEAHLAKDYSKAFDVATADLFTVDPMTERWLVRDISE